MHPDASAFESAILARPADRVAQLVYADWCDDHDDREFATALRSESFPVVARLAAEHGISLREGWERHIRAGEFVESMTVFGRRMGEMLRSVTLGLALSLSSGGQNVVRMNQPVVRRMS